MDYNEFANKIRKTRGPKKMKVTSSWGVYDAYKHIRKQGWYDIERPLKEHEFYSIIRGVNNLLAEEIVKGNTVAFPYRMGKLELRKHKVGVSIEKGKLKNTYPIDWDKTVKLWYDDEEERKKKTLVRIENTTSYYVKYDKRKSTYENKNFYQFVLNQSVKRALSKNISKGKIDTLW